MIVSRAVAYSAAHDFLQSVAQDLSAQQPFEASLEQQDFTSQDFLQSDALLVAAHELSAKAEIATADIKDNCWITFFIGLLFCILG